MDDYLMNEFEETMRIHAYQDNIVKIARRKWSKRWNHPITLWATRLIVWGVFVSGLILWYGAVNSKPSPFNAIIVMVAVIGGIRLSWRELKK